LIRASLPHEIPGRAATRIITEEARHQPHRLDKAERLDNVGGQANGRGYHPLSTRIGAVPLRSTGLHI
jgi:hypothetical protein